MPGSKEHRGGWGLPARSRGIERQGRLEHRCCANGGNKDAGTEAVGDRVELHQGRGRPAPRDAPGVVALLVGGVLMASHFDVVR
jgi:hypothetical protein